MTDSKIIAFVATQNPANALTFYRDTLGLSLVSDDPFAIVLAQSMDLAKTNA